MFCIWLYYYNMLIIGFFGCSMVFWVDMNEVYVEFVRFGGWNGMCKVNNKMKYFFVFLL